MKLERFSTISLLLVIFLMSCSAKIGTVVNPKVPIPKFVDKDLELRFLSHGFPRLANQIQACCDTRHLFDQLFLWDLAIIDAEMVRGLPEYLGQDGVIRSANPNIVLLAYFSAGDVNVKRKSPIISEFSSGIQDSWFLKDVKGKSVPLYRLANGDWTLAQNATSDIRNYVPAYLKQNVLVSGAFDGIFFDWMNPRIAWLNHRKPKQSEPIDIDLDGKADNDNKLNRLWKEGLTLMLMRSRAIFPPGTLIVGNNGWNTGPTFSTLLNGAMIENFLAGAKRNKKGFGWGAIMSTYNFFQNHSVTPKVFIIMATDNNEKNFEKMRFSLSSTLMLDGYFCFTNQTFAFATARWYDEYSVDLNSGKAVRNLCCKGYLGKPLSNAYRADKTKELLKDKLISNPTSAERTVWQRDFQHGIVLVNPSEQDFTVRLNGTFRKIRGNIDPTFNDGSELSEIKLGAQQGAILLR